MKISPDGKKIAVAHDAWNARPGVFELFDFDNINGVVSNLRLLCLENVYGVEFSSNSKLLYCSSEEKPGDIVWADKFPKNIIQYDLTATDMMNSATKFPLTEPLGALQLGPDNKIYFATVKSNKIGVIDNPNILGSGCSIRENAIDLRGRTSELGLPNFNQSFFTTHIKAENICEGETSIFTIETAQIVKEVIWDFGDGTASQNSIVGTHIYANPNVEYEVTATVTTVNDKITVNKKNLVNAKPIISPIVSLEQCEDNLNGFSTFNLTEADSKISSNFQNETFTYFKTLPDAQNNTNPINNFSAYTIQIVNNDVVYARVSNANDCFVVAQINLNIVAQVPKINLDTQVVLCVKEMVAKTIDAGLPDSTYLSDYIFRWKKDGVVIPNADKNELNINEKGIYTVEVSNSLGCSRTRTVTVIASDIAEIKNVNIEDLSDEKSIEIIVYETGNYVYSIDGLTYQASNLFYYVKSGIYTIYVKDLNGCGITDKQVSVLGIPKFFTPNGDGFNDYWNIKGANSNFNAKTQILIYNRYGKLIIEISPLKQGWDGTLYGNPLPADDYWYHIKLENGSVVKGHFALKR